MTVENENIQGVAGTTELESAHEKSPEQVQYEHEKQAFETHINTSDEAIPDNFKDAGSWFNSLKEAQKQYTQSRQEVSELKSQMEAIATPEPTPEADTPMPDAGELRIKAPEVPEITEPADGGVTEEVYDYWAMEFAANGGFSEDTLSDIKTRTGFSDRMLNDFIEGQNAKLRESYRNASTVVGGREKLDKIFEWAAKNLNTDEMQSVNIGLSSSTYEVTLRGLSSMYDNATKNTKAKEPAPNPKLTQVSASETGVLPYSTKREFTAERNNPKFQVEPAYRELVQQRMAITDWNTLRA